MDDLNFNDSITFYPPDSDGDVEIDFNVYDGCNWTYIPFDILEKWVASVRAQIISNSTDIKKK